MSACTDTTANSSAGSAPAGFEVTATRVAEESDPSSLGAIDCGRTSRRPVHEVRCLITSRDPITDEKSRMAGEGGARVLPALRRHDRRLGPLGRGSPSFPGTSSRGFRARTGEDYSIRIDQAQGLPGPFPVYYENSHLQAGAQEIQGYSALQALGKRAEGTDRLGTAILRKDFESTYLGRLPHAGYALVRRTYDIRKRVSSATCFTGLTVLGEYTTG